MWTPAEMIYVELGTLRSDAPSMIEALGRLAALELVDAGELGGEETLERLVRPERAPRLRNLAARCDEVAATLEGRLREPTRDVLADVERMTLEDCAAELESADRRARGLAGRAEQAREGERAARERHRLACRAGSLAPLAGTHGGLEIRLGRLRPAELDALPAELPSSVLIRVLERGAEPLLALFAPSTASSELDELLRAHRFVAVPLEDLADAAREEREAVIAARHAASELHDASSELLPRLSALRLRLERAARIASASRLVGVKGRGSVAAGWIERRRMSEVERRLDESMSVPVILRETDPGARTAPTALHNPRALEGFQRLVETYAPIPYRDVDPTPAVSLSFTVMFALMFADLGQGALLAVAGAWLGWRPPRALEKLRGLGPALVIVGLASMLTGLLFGEFFGPSGVLGRPVLDPLEEPEALLAAGTALGALMIIASFVASVVNRIRERRPVEALTSLSAGGGLALYVGVLALGAGLALGIPVAGGIGIAGILVGVGALAAGSAYGAAVRGPLAVAGRTVAEALEGGLRLASNTVSFVRLGAFALAHAALSVAVLDIAGGVAGGPFGAAAAAIVFVTGTAVAILLEGLVVTIQALRLHYYELFGRIYPESGRPFRPFRLESYPAVERGGGS